MKPFVYELLLLLLPPPPRSIHHSGEQGRRPTLINLSGFSKKSSL